MKAARNGAEHSARPPVRVAYLLRTYPRFSQTFVVNEILELERQGLDLRIVSLRRPDDGLFHELVCRVNARAEYLPETRLGLLGKYRAAWSRAVRRAPAALLRAGGCVVRHRDVSHLDLLRAMALLRWCDKRRIDHVHVHFGTDEATVAWLAHIVGRLAYSMTLHAFDIFRNDVDWALLAQKINASRFTVTVSEFNRRFLEQLPGVAAHKIRVNYNGVDLARFRPAARPREPRLLMGVGRLIEKKGFLHLVRAIGRLHSEGVPARADIIGEGREEQSLRAEIARLDLQEHVRLPGPLKLDEVRRMMQSAACFVLPCVAARDGNIDALPTVLLESLACGCPTVSTRLSGIPEIIEDQVSGLLVEPGDDQALAAAVRAVLTQPMLAARLADGGRRRAEERFDIRRNVGLMNDWLQAAAGHERASAARVSPPVTQAAVSAASET